MFKVYNRRYTGSKLKLADWIIEIIQKNCKGESFFEAFAGTSIISSRIAPYMKKIVLNDTLESNRVIYEAFYGEGNYSNEKLIDYSQEFATISFESEPTGFFSENYGGKYFSLIDAKQIEFIRNAIERDKSQFSKKEYFILLASLIYSMDRCANTVGHFDSYINKKPVSKEFVFDLIEPMNFNKTKFKIYQEDANILAPRVSVDITYIDPPYNSRQYCQFYHIYETLIRWDEPELFGIALKPKAKYLSDYCRVAAPVVFADLLTKLKSKYFVVSYNNTYKSKSSSSRNKITHRQMIDILSTYGKPQIFFKEHRFFNAGKTSFSNHKEFLFVVEVGER